MVGGGATRGGVVVTGVGATPGRVVTAPFGEVAPLGKGVPARPVKRGATVTAGGGGAGGCLAGRHDAALLAWHSTHFVGKLWCPGNVLESYSGR